MNDQEKQDLKDFLRRAAEQAILRLDDARIEHRLLASAGDQVATLNSWVNILAIQQEVRLRVDFCVDRFDELLQQ